MNIWLVMSNTTVPVIDGSKKYLRVRSPLTGAATPVLDGTPHYCGLKLDALRILQKPVQQRTSQVHHMKIVILILKCYFQNLSIISKIYQLFPYFQPYMYYKWWTMFIHVIACFSG